VTRRSTVLLVVMMTAAVAVSQDRVAQRAAGMLKRRATASLAQTSGRIELPGLKKPVQVIRDQWGVPHIYAETEDDLFFAQGFVAAQDRLWQMEIWRRTGEGRLAEILGPQAVERDKFARLMKFRGDMDSEWRSYAPDARQIVESFVKGVNGFIENCGRRLPIEFLLTGIKPEPWTPEVCLTRMAGYIMTGNASREVLRAQLVKAVGAKKASELIETDPFKQLSVPRGLDLSDIDSRILAGATAASGPVSFRSNEGSNNWVVDGTMTSTGKPLLANDPHRTITLPSLRYITHLVGPGWNVIGAGEPTLPGISAGHNERVGFGFTIVGIDQQDIYVEQTSPDDPTSYRYRGSWEKMRVERERIKVKNSDPVEVELHFTRHGPVIYEDPKLHRAYALRWIGMEPGSAGYLASLSVDRARNWEQFSKALERWSVPSENLVYADVDGNIGWQAVGWAPKRRGWSGLIPVPGDSGDYEWDGYLPLSELPHSYNPARHFIATANHKIIPEGYKHEINFDWALPFRFRRIDEVLSKGGKFTVADFQKLQLDELSIPAREFVSLLKGLLIDSPRAARDAQQLLLSWDCVLAKDSAAAALYETWVQELTSRFGALVVPPEAKDLVPGGLLFNPMLKALLHPTRRVFGANPDARATTMLLQSLADAMTELSGRFGSDWKKWRWGDLHVAEFRHQLSTDDARRAAFDLAPVARGGDGNTVNATGFGGKDYVQRAGASFREILDLSNWDNSVAINVPGQSGQPQSRHYGDLLMLWAEGKYFPLLFSREQIEANAAERLSLVPRPQPAQTNQ
jgi:penicillin amidase